MPYAQLDVHFDEHPAHAELSLEHLGIQACAIAYCNRLLTDGFIPKKQIRLWGQPGDGERVASEMVTRHLWAECAGGYKVEGYLDHNPSRKSVSEKKKSHKARQDRYRSNYADKLKSVTRHGAVTGDAAVTRPSTTTDPSPSPSIYRTNEKAKAVRPKRPMTKCPDSLVTTEELIAWAKTWNVPAGDPEFLPWLDWHRARDERRADWSASWRTWKNNAKRFSNHGRQTRIVQPAGPNEPWIALASGRTSS